MENIFLSFLGVAYLPGPAMGIFIVGSVDAPRTKDLVEFICN